MVDVEDADVEDLELAEVEPEAPADEDEAPVAEELEAPEPVSSTGVHPDLQEYLDKGYSHAQLVVKTYLDGSFKSVEVAENV